MKIVLDFWKYHFAQTRTSQLSMVSLYYTTAKMALVNARSISNSKKKFILNDIFTSYSLDFLFLSETWIKHCDLMPLVEIAPPDCAFFSSSQASGCGGGVATIFRSSFNCKTVPTDTFSNFEVQLLKVDVKGPVLCLASTMFFFIPYFFSAFTFVSRDINSNTANLFSEHYSLYVTNDILNETDTESLIEGFYKACSIPLDTAAPLKHTSVKGGSQPWLNETTRALRQEWWKTE